MRGKFIREALLCTSVPKPPPNLALEIPEAAPDMPTTKRDRLDLHRSKPGCATCHAEQFDAIGRYRTMELGLPIDATGEFDGVAVADAQDMGVVMSSSQKPSGTLLDSALVYVTSDTAWGKVHDNNEWPVLLAGNAGGRLRGDEHHNFQGESLSRALLTVAQAIGVETAEFGVDNGRVTASLPGIIV